VLSGSQGYDRVVKQRRRRVMRNKGSKLGPVEGFCEHGYEPSGSINCGEYLD